MREINNKLLPADTLTSTKIDFHSEAKNMIGEWYAYWSNHSQLQLGQVMSEVSKKSHESIETLSNKEWTLLFRSLNQTETSNLQGTIDDIILPIGEVFKEHEFKVYSYYLEKYINPLKYSNSYRLKVILSFIYYCICNEPNLSVGKLLYLAKPKQAEYARLNDNEWIGYLKQAFSDIHLRVGAIY